MAVDSDSSRPDKKPVQHPFRQAVLRGLAVISPPLFTVLIFAWVISTTNRYVLQPVTTLVREAVVWTANPVRETLPESAIKSEFVELDGGTYIPKKVYRAVEAEVQQSRKAGGNATMPEGGEAIYRRYVELEYLNPYYAIPFFVALFVLALYLLGKFMAAGIGRFFWFRFEGGIHRLPLIRNVYSSVKQVSDFLFTEPEIEYTRVVAVEYPRKGIWSLGLVTGESMLDIRAAANEPILSVLMPTSPMPVTGFTVTVRKSETVDLNITIEQAFQFIISCGVVVPPQQLQRMLSVPDALPSPAGSAQPAASEQEVVDGG